MRRAAASAQASVRQRATALLKLLGADGAAAAPSASRPSPVGDLMGGMDEPSPAAAPQASAQDLLGVFPCTDFHIVSTLIPLATLTVHWSRACAYAKENMCASMCQNGAPAMCR